MWGAELCVALIWFVRLRLVKLRLAIDPIGFHLLVARRLYACRYGASTFSGAARKFPIRLRQLCADHLDEAEWARPDDSSDIAGPITIEHKHHEPACLNIVALPSLQIARGFDFDALVGILDSIAGESARRNEVRMSIMVEILRERAAVFGNSDIHVLADNTAEIGRHEE